MKYVAIVMVLIAAATAAAVEPTPLHVSIRAEADNGLSGKLLSLLSKEVRRLDQVVVTDDSPEFIVSCSVVSLDMRNARGVGYAASVAVTVGDGHMLGNFVEVDNSLESLAHEVALAVDRRFIESLRKAKSSSPEKSQ